MRVSKYLYLLIFVCLLLVSCTETTDSDEFNNWQAKNESYFVALYLKTDSIIKNGSKKWKILRKWSLAANYETKMEDHIVVEVLNENNLGTQPIYTDSVKVHLRGNLISFDNNTEGTRFISSYRDELDLSTAIPMSISANGTIFNRQIDGLCTALQYMHVGDRWKLYIPYQLGYGDHSSKNPLVPSYSTLIMDVNLVSIYRK